ncbi:MAG TPA: phosphonopyruvate decarboxylase [Myxococcota bacterium]|nr:phosphonopyruvate decarboxylase [Myxococcota bacterium]HOH76541.1 phosphonopyruvate decarboxylase [Myxococcota bacterium]HPV04570.1 phosphonopyruvate decarboxylase [Myxococcota bacterium]
MINPIDFIQYLADKGSGFFTGIPDSTFKGLTALFDSGAAGFVHLGASNECEAMGIAAGYHLSTGRIPVVYMQNSGFGKTVNPYTSLTARDVYSMPVLMIIGWRGEPGIKDEPQHKMMGRILPDLLRTLEIESVVLDPDDWMQNVDMALDYCRRQNAAFALVVRSGVFAESPAKDKAPVSTLPLREEILERLVQSSPTDALFISTTGKTSRELYEIRDRLQMSHANDFYTVGSMGCASSIALGVSHGDHNRPIFILDGDGAALMQMGTFAALGKHGQDRKITHVLIDNQAHESTGGQPTLSSTVSFQRIAEGCGYQAVLVANNLQEFEDCLGRIGGNDSLKLLVVRSRKGSRPDLGRPKTSPIENRINFMESIRNGQAVS